MDVKEGKCCFSCYLKWSVILPNFKGDECNYPLFFFHRYKMLSHWLFIILFRFQIPSLPLYLSIIKGKEKHKKAFQCSWVAATLWWWCCNGWICHNKHCCSIFYISLYILPIVIHYMSSFFICRFKLWLINL